MRSGRDSDFLCLWMDQIQALDLTSPLDRKARNAACAYFAETPRSITACAGRLGVKRDTALRRLQRAEEKGWVNVYDTPPQARGATLPRVVGRNVFWPGGLPEWDGDTTSPVF